MKMNEGLRQHLQQKWEEATTKEEKDKIEEVIKTLEYRPETSAGGSILKGLDAPLKASKNKVSQYTGGNEAEWFPPREGHYNAWLEDSDKREAELASVDQDYAHKSPDLIEKIRKTKEDALQYGGDPLHAAGNVSGDIALDPLNFVGAPIARLGAGAAKQGAGAISTLRNYIPYHYGTDGVELTSDKLASKAANVWGDKVDKGIEAATGSVRNKGKSEAERKRNMALLLKGEGVTKWAAGGAGNMAKHLLSPTSRANWAEHGVASPNQALVRSHLKQMEDMRTDKGLLAEAAKVPRTQEQLGLLAEIKAAKAGSKSPVVDTSGFDKLAAETASIKGKIGPEYQKQRARIKADEKVLMAQKKNDVKAKKREHDKEVIALEKKLKNTKNPEADKITKQVSGAPQDNRLESKAVSQIQFGSSHMPQHSQLARNTPESVAEIQRLSFIEPYAPLKKDSVSQALRRNSVTLDGEAVPLSKSEGDYVAKFITDNFGESGDFVVKANSIQTGGHFNDVVHDNPAKKALDSMWEELGDGATTADMTAWLKKARKDGKGNLEGKNNWQVANQQPDADGVWLRGSKVGSAVTEGGIGWLMKVTPEGKATGFMVDKHDFVEKALPSLQKGIMPNDVVAVSAPLVTNLKMAKNPYGQVPHRGTGATYKDVLTDYTNIRPSDAGVRREAIRMGGEGLLAQRLLDDETQ